MGYIGNSYAGPFSKSRRQFFKQVLQILFTFECFFSISWTEKVIFFPFLKTNF